jgi:tetratricopeptide (TPR) repeat protein
LGDFPRAFDALRAGLELARETENASAIQHSLMRLGTFYLFLALPEEALPLLEEARALADRMDLPTRQTWVMSTIAAVLAEQGRLEEALELQGEVLRIARTIDTGTYEGDALWGMGGLLIGRDPAEALTYLDGAVRAYEGIGRPVGWGVWADYGRALRVMGDLDRASRMYWKAIGGLESARQVIASDYHRATFFEQSRRIYEQLVELLIERYQQERDTSHIAQAFEVVERAKARNLTEAIRAARDGAFGPDDPALRRQEQELLARRTELQRRLMASGVPRERRIELSRELDRAEREYDRLVGEIRRSDPRYAAALYPEPVGPELARTLIGRGSAIVLYFFTEKVVYRFLLTSERYEVEPLDVEPAVLSARVENYLELLAGDHDGWRDISRRLADELLPSLEGVTEIIFVPDRTLHFLPFETLLTTTTAGTRGRFLLETHTVSYTPSLTVLHGLARDETTEDARPADLLLFADPTSAYVSGDDDEATGMRAFYEQEGVAVPPIPYSAREASAIHRLARRGSEVYIGDAASEAMLKSRELDRFRVLHMATHGLISQWRPARSSLVLSPSPDGSEDGFLQVREIFQLRMNTDLVVLSACRTARGKVLGGEGVQGLAQAFLHAGSQTVVASLWDVDDVATAGLMDRFYRYLARGLPKGQALRRAKLDTLHTIGGAAPRHWGAFVMIGAAAQPVSLSGLAWWRSPGAWLFVVLVLGMTALGVRRVARRR